MGCFHAIYCVRNIVNHYVTNGSTVNLCALDITKAFGRMNHHGLFVKLMWYVSIRITVFVLPRVSV